MKKNIARRVQPVLGLYAVLGLLAQSAQAAPPYTYSGPITHENLSIYMVHGASNDKIAPLTLQEAVKKKLLKVHETGDVNRLSIENLGKQQIFIQSGELVKGGKQDRVLTTSMLLPPKSGKVPIDAFCVEQGRWAKRGAEDQGGFIGSNFAMPSREAKLAMKAPSKNTSQSNTGSTTQNRPQATVEPINKNNRNRRDIQNNIQQRATVRGGESRQDKVWKNVDKIQRKLSAKLNKNMKSDVSPSSLQLTLEDKKLKKVQGEYMKALSPVVKGKVDVVGFVFAINGELNSADIYPSNTLFMKLWPKLLRASVIEAIGEKEDGKTAEPPTADAVEAFLGQANTGKPVARTLNKHIKLTTRDGKGVVFFETRYKEKQWVHRNYLAKDKK